MGGFIFSDPRYGGKKLSFKLFGKRIKFLHIKLHLKHLGIKSIPNIRKNGATSLPPSQCFCGKPFLLNNIDGSICIVPKTEYCYQLGPE